MSLSCLFLYLGVSLCDKKIDCRKAKMHLAQSNCCRKLFIFSDWINGSKGVIPLKRMRLWQFSKLALNTISLEIQYCHYTLLAKLYLHLHASLQHAVFVLYFQVSLCFWPLCMALNFKFVPQYLRVVFIGFASFVWANILSILKSKQ